MVPSTAETSIGFAPRLRGDPFTDARVTRPPSRCHVRMGEHRYNRTTDRPEPFHLRNILNRCVRRMEYVDDQVGPVQGAAGFSRGA